MDGLTAPLGAVSVVQQVVGTHVVQGNCCLAAMLL